MTPHKTGKPAEREENRKAAVHGEGGVQKEQKPMEPNQQPLRATLVQNIFHDLEDAAKLTHFYAFMHMQCIGVMPQSETNCNIFNAHFTTCVKPFVSWQRADIGHTEMQRSVAFSDREKKFVTECNTTNPVFMRVCGLVTLVTLFFRNPNKTKIFSGKYEQIMNF